jgi:imidazolonepropionase-like amidohydrolase
MDWVALHDADKIAPEDLDAIAKGARLVGIRVMASAQGRPEAEAAIGAGAETLEYVFAESADTYDAGFLHAAGGRGAYFSMPVGYYRRIAEYRAHPALLDNPGLYPFMPTEVASQVANAQKKQINDPSTPRREPELVEARFRELLKGGARLVISTDSGSAGQMHRTAYWTELAEWYRLGAPVPRILDAATRRPAKMLGRSDLGSLTVGSRGDFVLYRGDPLKGDFDVEKVSAVAKGGVLFVKDGRWIGP